MKFLKDGVRSLGDVIYEPVFLDETEYFPVK